VTILDDLESADYKKKEKTRSRGQLRKKLIGKYINK
jgi:hypothetical protein